MKTGIRKGRIVRFILRGGLRQLVWSVLGVCLLAGAVLAQTDDPEWEATFRQRREWWSLQPVVEPPIPAVRNPARCADEVDRFVLSRLDAASLAPAPAADRRTLLRRLSFALTGLPPTPGEIEQFLSDDAPQAFEGDWVSCDG